MSAPWYTFQSTSVNGIINNFQILNIFNQALPVFYVRIGLPIRVKLR